MSVMAAVSKGQKRLSENSKGNAMERRSGV